MPPKKTTNSNPTSRKTRSTRTSDATPRSRVEARAEKPSKSQPRTTESAACHDIGDTIDVRTKEVRRQSHAIDSGAIHTQAGLAVPKIAELERALAIDSRAAEAVHQKIEELAKWIAADKKRSLEFQKAPIRVLTERDPQLASHLHLLHPKLLDVLLGLAVPGCDNLPPQSEYADCVRGILRRVAVWMQSSGANRAVFKTDTDAAVDSAAPVAPAIAKMLAKQALRTASAIQGGAA